MSTNSESSGATDPLVVAANSEWDRLLRQAPPSVEAVKVWQIEHQVVWDEPLCKVLRPGFVTTQQQRSDEEAARAVWSALRRASALVKREPDLQRRYLGDYWQQHRDFFDLGSLFSHPEVYVRLDAYPTQDGPVFLELNSAPGASIRLDTLTCMFEQLAVFQRFSNTFQLERMTLIDKLRDAMLSAYRSWGGAGNPTVAALRRPRRLVSERERIRDAAMETALRDVGVNLHVVDHSELTFSGGRLRYRDLAIDIIFPGLFVYLVTAERASLEALHAAVRARAVFLLNPFGIDDHKAMFAAITEPAPGLSLTAAEAEAVHKHVPWTRVVRDERSTDPTGAHVDLLAWAAEHREQLVLKPSADYGGRGVVFGWQTEPPVWATALQQACVREASHVLQARVHPVLSTWPLCEPGLPDITWTADRCMYLINGSLAGYFTRMSKTALTNLFAGGGMTPTFLLKGYA